MRAPGFGGAVPGIPAFGIDVAELDRALDEAGPAGAALYRALLEHLPDAVVTTDQRGIVRDFNRAAERLFMRAAKTVVGTSVRALFPDEEAVAVLQRIAEKPDGTTTVHRALRGDAAVTDVSLQAWIVAGDEGPATMLIFRAQDGESSRAEIDRLAHENEMILNAAGEGIIRIGLDGRASFANVAAERALGYSTRQLTQGKLHDIIHHSSPDGKPYPLDQCQIVAAWRDGEVHRVDSEVFWRSDGTWFPVEYISAPIHEDGVVAGGVLTFRDISERKAAEAEVRRTRDMFKFFANVTRVLADAPLDPDERLRILARQFVPTLVDWCAIDLLTDDPDGLQRFVVEHVDPERVALAVRLAELYPPDPDSPYGPFEVIRTGRTQLIEDITDDMIVAAARDERHAAMLRELQMRAAAIVPITARGHALGTLTLVTAESGRPITREDASMYETVAARAAMLIENARLFKERSRVAQTLQQTLLPPELPAIDGLEVAARYVAAGGGVDVGGDFYDIFQTDPNDWALVVGDVSGKGVEAAVVTALARYSIRAAAIDARKPAAVLSVLNRAILKSESDRFCTACYVRIRPKPDGARVTVCCGGHPRPLVLRAAGRLEEVACSGTLLGMFESVDLDDRSLRLKAGDALILFTDGVTEARNRTGFLGERTLRKFVRGQAGKSADEIAAGIEQLAVDWQENRPRDDIAVVVVRVPGGDETDG